MKYRLIKNRVYKKSSFSPDTRHAKCVGVSISTQDVLVTNLTTKSSVVLFSRDEWEAFIKGVKNNEFDLTSE